ncbi:hemerythrin domain-containing protein [Nonomuraea rhodomycinica]|uniref:Hemerythrin domain-containing protein n=1 Tax=Nonomuraea rhodomycinica TaxID=1712872 RepID=A0A7Y6MDX9_9ACTN|nr:hemerythrin domain-containing protein [Nonomuraea rhodomycinica]NUW43069.1 hemerythrin domain-containing protein [Nonomuraea rhodomycinica]
MEVPTTPDERPKAPHQRFVAPDERLEAFGNQLINVHAWLREELAGLRGDVEAHLAGRSSQPRELSAHCLAFCSALERHHTGEDAVAFPALAEQFPQLRPVLQELTRDHRIISDILRRLQNLLDSLGEHDSARPRDVQAELDGLAALMESHFTYEERKIAAALGALDIPGWGDAPPAFLLAASTDAGDHASHH